MANKRLVIIDGNSLIFRAFYALPELTTKDGVQTNGVYGFLSMFFKIEEDLLPDYFAVVFDKKGATFRHEAYSEYKAGRKETPNELVLQFVILKELLEKMGIPWFDMDGYEADDIAGTLAKKAEKMGVEVYLVTGDRDYLQLVSENIKVMFTKKGISKVELYDLNTIKQEYNGLSPNELIDLKGLMGDASDNIPGVPGVGAKTGLKLMAEYGSLDKLYENVELMKKSKLKDKLIENKASAYLSRKLGEICLNLPIEFVPEEFKKREVDNEELVNSFKELEFKTFIPKIKMMAKDYGEFVPLAEKEYSYKISSSIDDVLEAIKSDKKMIYKIYCQDEKHIPLAIAIRAEGENIIFRFTNDYKLEIEKLREVSESKEIEKIGFDLKNEIILLKNYGIETNLLEFDVMVAKYLLNPGENSYTINGLTEEYFNETGSDLLELLGKGKSKKTLSEIPEQALFTNFAYVVESIEKLYYKLKDLIIEQEMDELLRKIELPLISILADMEFLGININVEVLESLREEYTEEIENLTNDIYISAGRSFNINSPKQLGEILFDELKLPVMKKTKTGYSTDVEVLEALKSQHEIVNKILRYRLIVKLNSTYIDGLLNAIDINTGRIHTKLKQTVTSTGRISSIEPNLQNIPIRTEEGKKIRKAFIAKNSNYKLIDADYSQIELRVLAQVTGDKTLINAFNEGEDIHSQTAAEVFGVDIADVTPLMRSHAKAVNFGIMYGMSDFGLSRELGISRKEAKIFIDNYLSNFPGVEKYMDKSVEDGKKKGYVETIFHRRRYVPELNSKNFNIRSAGKRIAMNTPIQGSAADIIKLAMVEVSKELEKNAMKAKLILQIHDELIFDCPENEVKQVEELVKKTMENVVKLNIPLTVDLKVGDNWYETK